MTLRRNLTSFAVSLVSSSLFADEYVDSKSPDGKFALRVTREDQEPFRQSAALVEAKTRKVILDLDTKYAVQFDRQQPASIVKIEPETMSVVDYYLLLPDKTFETPARGWLHNATVIDKQNGYLSISGDGAQPSFDLALFRYRDGRPLLALCEGELEGDDSVTLEFFELGADGRMSKSSRKIFPVGDAWRNGTDEPQPQSWYFELPRHGRSVLVRSLKTKRILHRVTWNGEKFVEQRDAASN